MPGVSFFKTGELELEGSSAVARRTLIPGVGLVALVSVISGCAAPATTAVAGDAVAASVPEAGAVISQFASQIGLGVLSNDAAAITSS